MSTSFIKSATKASLLALTKKGELTPKFWARLLEALVTKDELQNYVDSFESGGGVDHGTTTGLGDDDHVQYLLKNGSRALTANWDAGNYEIRSSTFESDVATGTAPLTIASTTVVPNLNSDLLDGQQGTYYLDSDNFTGTEWTDLTDAGETALHIHDGRYFTESEITTTLSGYLPLTAGSTKALTGDLYIDTTAPDIKLRDGGSATDYSTIKDSGPVFSIGKVAATGAATIEIANTISDGSSNSAITFHSGTSTTGVRSTSWISGVSQLHRIADGVANFGNFSGGNYVQAREEGLYLVGTATMWDDLRFAAVSTKLGGSKDPTFAVFLTDGEVSPSQGVFLYWFDKANEKELFFAAQMPHSWKEGTDIEAHVHWVGKSTAAGAGTDVSWGLEYTWANINGTFGNTDIIYGDEQSNGATEIITINKHYLTELGTITGTDKTLSSMLICRVFRDAAGVGGTDDYDDDAGLLEIDFHYQVDSFGSKEEYVKGP